MALTVIEQAIANKHIEKMISDFPEMGIDSAKSFIEKALISKEIETVSDVDIVNWYENIFKKYLFIIDEQTYLEASIQALKVQFLLAGTDFGSSRQRDLGQKWSDTIRGYLGEFGLKQVFNNFGIEIDLGHEAGALEQFLPQDIHMVKLEGETDLREPSLKVSIKTTKSNGIWLDIPGDQFNHSDIYILAKIGIGTDHLFSFFKQISVFKDKILKCGKDQGCLDEEEAEIIYNQVPSFHKIYGYIPGFIEYSSVYDNYHYEGRKGRTNFKIYDWAGKYEKSFLNIIKTNEKANKVEFEGIGQFADQNKYIFGMKSLKNADDEWERLIFNRL